MTDPSLTPDSPVEPKSLIEIAKRLPEASPSVASWAALTGWVQSLTLIRHRKALPQDAPILTILLGPTGAGKSTVFNQLLGRVVSTAGAIRPCTTHPIAAAHSEVVEFFRRDPILQSGPLSVDWAALEPSEWYEQQALVDCPDFDGVEPDNRAMADLLLQRADRVVLVVSPDKYADATVWDTIDALRPLNKLVGAIFNKDEGTAAATDFARLLAENDLPGALVAKRLESPNDLDQLDPEYRAQLREMLSLDEGPDIVFRRLLEALESKERSQRKEQIAPWVADQGQALERIGAELARLRDGLASRIEKKLPLELDEALRIELQSRFVKLIQRYDLLREPRRWLMAPFQWIRHQFSGSDGAEPGPALASSDWLTEAYRDRFHEFRLDLANELRALGHDLRKTSEPHLSWAEVGEPDPEVITEELRGVFVSLRERIEAESERIAEGLSTSGKFSFYGSQVLFHSVMLGVLVKSGGLLSIGEMAAQGLLSPFVAKIAEHLVSSGEAAEVEKRLGTFFCERLAAVVETSFEPCLAHLEQLNNAVPDQDSWQNAARSWERGDA